MKFSCTTIFLKSTKNFFSEQKHIFFRHIFPAFVRVPPFPTLRLWHLKVLGCVFTGSDREFYSTEVVFRLAKLSGKSFCNQIPRKSKEMKSHFFYRRIKTNRRAVLKLLFNFL